MSIKEQSETIKELRSRIVKLKTASSTVPSVKPQVDEISAKEVWEKAERAGKTISDDSLSTPHLVGA